MELRRTQIGWSMPPLREDTPPRIIDGLQKRSFFGKPRNSNTQDEIFERRHTAAEATKPRILNKHHLRNNKSRMTETSKEQSKVMLDESSRVSITQAFPKISPLDFRVSEVLHSISHTTDLQTPRQNSPKIDPTLSILQSDHHRLQQQHRRLVDQHTKNQQLIHKMRENECLLSTNLDNILLNVKMLEQNLRESQENNRILKIDLISRENKLLLLEEYESNIKLLQQKLKNTELLQQKLKNAEEQIRCKILEKQQQTITFARQGTEKQQFEEEIRELNEKIKQKQIQMQRLREQFAHSQQHRHQINAALLESNTALKESNDTIQVFNQALKESQAQILFLHEKIQQLEKDIKQHNDISKVTWLESKLDSLQQQIFQLRQQKKQKIAKSGQFNHFLKDQIEDNQKLKNQLIAMDQQLRAAQQQLCSQRFTVDSYKNQVEMERLRSITERKALQVDFDIRQQNYKNQIGSLKKLLFVTEQRLRIAINDNIHKDQFIKMHIIGKTKSQYDRKDIEEFFKQYEIAMPKEPLNKALRKELTIIEQQKEELEKLRA